MLAQNFKTPEELGVTEKGYVGLLKVLRMLESGELVWTPPYSPIPNGFNMARCWEEHTCGTIGCIGGYAGWYPGWYPNAINTGISHGGGKGNSLGKLFSPPNWGSGHYTVDQAAKALRSYLVTGEADWGLD